MTTKRDKILERYYEGQDYYYGTGRRKNYRKAFEYLLPAAELGIPHAQNLVGQCYDNGCGTVIDKNEAFRWYRRAAINRGSFGTTKRNHAIAVCNLAMMYDQGCGTQENPKLAFKYYLEAAQLGDIIAQCNLGILFEEGRGVTPNKDRAIYWTRKAARKGDSKAQYNLGLAYLYGDGVRVSKKSAVNWFKKATYNGHRKAKKELENL